jgi:hypothetical protein
VGLRYISPNDMGSWTIVFQFDRGHSALESSAITRLIRAWIGRFGYFLGLVKNFSDVSLPAVVGF